MQNERTFYLSVEQSDGFGFGGSFTRKQIHDLLATDGYSVSEIDGIIDNGGIENTYHTVVVKPDELPC